MGRVSPAGEGSSWLWPVSADGHRHLRPARRAASSSRCRTQGEEMPSVTAILSHVRKAQGASSSSTTRDVRDDRERRDLLARENVLVQLEHLRTLPLVCLGLDRGDLHLHGWMYRDGRSTPTTSTKNSSCRSRSEDRTGLRHGRRKSFQCPRMSEVAAQLMRRSPSGKPHATPTPTDHCAKNVNLFQAVSFRLPRGRARFPRKTRSFWRRGHGRPKNRLSENLTFFAQ